MSTVILGKNNRLKLPRPKLGPSRPNRLRKVKPPRGEGQSFETPRYVIFALKAVLFGSLALGLLSVLGLGLLYGYRFVTTHAYFGLTEIAVTGNERLPYGDVLAAAEVKLGQNCLEVNVGGVEARLSGSPWIKAASVRRELPNRLVIHVEERQPSFWVRQGERMHYADALGNVITQVQPGEFASLPVLELDPEAGAASRAALLALPRIVERMNRLDLPFGLGQMAWIRVVEPGELELFLDGPRLALRFSLDGFETQLTRLSQVWKDLLRRDELAKVAAISAREGRVWVEMRHAVGG